MRALFRLASRSILRHWRYSLGAFLSVAAGFFALSLFRAYMLDVAFLFEETYQHRGMYGHLLIERSGDETDKKRDLWAYSLDAADQAFIDDFLKKEGERVLVRVRFLVAGGMVSNGRTSALYGAKGYDVAEGVTLRGPVWGWDTAAGKPLHLADNPESVVIGRGLAAILDCKIFSNGKVFTKFGGYSAIDRPFECPEKGLQFSATTEPGQSNAVDVPLTGIVDGIFKEIDSKYVMLPLPVMQRLYDTNRISFYAVELARDRDVESMRERFNFSAQSAGRALRAIRWQNHPEGDLYLRTMSFLAIFRNFVVTILIAITGFSVFNTFLKAVKERTREIGTLRSLGFRRREVTHIFGVEAFLLSLGGAGFGVLTAVIATSAINAAGILYKAGILAEPVPFRIAYSPGIYATSAVFLVVIAVCAALLAVTWTVRRSIAENLIHA